MSWRVVGSSSVVTTKKIRPREVGVFSWQGFVIRNQTLAEEILISDAELSRIEDEIREIRELLDGA